MKPVPSTGLLLCLTLAILPAPGKAQMLITGGNPVLQITGAAPGEEPTVVTNVICTLEWQKESVNTKVTVSTACPGQRFTLRVVATGLTGPGGVAAPEVTLSDGMPDVDFITDIPRTGPRNRRATLQYTASATFAQGNSSELGDDLHTVTYTVVAQ